MLSVNEYYAIEAHHALPGQKICRTLQKCGYDENNQT